jgi:hypothetical protein
MILRMILYCGHFCFDGYLYVEELPNIFYYQYFFFRKAKRWEISFFKEKEKMFNAKASGHPG